MRRLEITKLEIQKNNKNRVNVFLDGDFYCGLSLETVMKNSLKVGSNVDKENIDYLKNETETEIALNKAVGYISKYAKTKKQIKDYLFKKGFDEFVVDFVISKMEEYNFVNDEQYANAFVKSKTKNNGKKKILMQLKQNGINEQVANLSVENFSKDDENIFSICEKYLKNKPIDIKTKQKTYRFLISKGYETEDVLKCLNKFFKDN